MDVQIVPFDPETASRAEWTRYHAYRRLRHAETDPGDPLAKDATVEAWMRRPQPTWQQLHYAVLGPERPGSQIGGVYYEGSRPGSPSHETNKHIGLFAVELLRPHRRRGLGRSILPHIVSLARAQGRTVLQSWAEETDGKAFAAAIGAKTVQRRRHNRLRFDAVDWAMVERWAAEGPKRNPHTTLRWFRNRIDDDVLDRYCALYTEVFNMQPFEDAERGKFIFTRVDMEERATTHAAAGSTWVTAVTEEADGSLSGQTEVIYTPDESPILWQGLTGVANAYRGRGLGKWTKAAMLLRVRREFPDIRIVGTNNNATNEAMLSINERLGFRTHKEPIVVQMKLEDLEAYLRRHGLLA